MVTETVRKPKTSDKTVLKRKMLLGMLTGPATVAPFIAGVTGLLCSWALNWRPDLGVFSFLGGVLAAGGVFLTKLVVHGDQYAQRAVEEAQRESRSERERALDELDAKLAADQDPRTESALRDLRSMALALEELDKAGIVDLDAPALVEVRVGFARLFDQCVAYLERSLALLDTARKVATEAARKPILAHREHVVAEVYQSIGQLGKMLYDLQNLGSSADRGSQLSQIRDQLDQSLTVAKQVDARLEAFENQLEQPTRE